MQIHQGVKSLIGHTPIVEITQFPLPDGVRLFAKLEYYNPGGSIKDRLGIELIRDAEERGLLKKGGTIVEPTAGNTGIGIALAAVGTGYRVLFVVPEKFSQEKQELMRALGAEVVNTPTEKGIRGAIEKAQELAKELGAYCPQQFANPANPQAHYKTTGPEMWSQMDGNIDIFIAGAGSGGTFMGCAKYLKEQRPLVKTVIVEPEGSILGGGEAGSHKTEGIGMEFLPPYMEPQYFDEIYSVLDSDSFDLVKQLAKKEGLLVGSSSGAAMWAALEEAKKAKPGSHIITIFPDSSERYLSKKIYQGGI